MLTAIIFIGLALYLGVPFRKTLGLTFNPIWPFTNLKEIKKNTNRAGDFYGTIQPAEVDSFSIQLPVEKIPKSKLNYTTTDRKPNK